MKMFGMSTSVSLIASAIERPFSRRTLGLGQRPLALRVKSSTVESRLAVFTRSWTVSPVL